MLIPSNVHLKFNVHFLFIVDLGTKWKTVNIDVNESILSLLMKLHARLSCKPNSYVPESETSGPANPGDSR